MKGEEQTVIFSTVLADDCPTLHLNRLGSFYEVIDQLGINRDDVILTRMEPVY